MKHLFLSCLRGGLKWVAVFAMVLAVAACPGGKAGNANDPVAGSTEGSKPVGLFFFMDLFNHEALYYFAPDGQVYYNPEHFTPAALAAVDVKSHGTYARSGDEMTVKWANGLDQTFAYHSDPTGFSWNGSFVCVGPFASSGQFQGTFEGHNAAVQVDANSLALYRTLHFKPDGTFGRDNYAAAHLETDAGATNDVASAAQQAGHWKLDGWYLTLTDAGGQTVRALAFPTSLDEKTNKAYYFRFNGTTYKNNDL